MLILWFSFLFLSLGDDYTNSASGMGRVVFSALISMEDLWDAFSLGHVSLLSPVKKYEVLLGAGWLDQDRAGFMGFLDSWN